MYAHRHAFSELKAVLLKEKGCLLNNFGHLNEMAYICKQFFNAKALERIKFIKMR